MPTQQEQIDALEKQVAKLTKFAKRIAYDIYRDDFTQGKKLSQILNKGIPDDVEDA